MYGSFTRSSPRANGRLTRLSAMGHGLRMPGNFTRLGLVVSGSQTTLQFRGISEAFSSVPRTVSHFTRLSANLWATRLNGNFVRFQITTTSAVGRVWFRGSSTATAIIPIPPPVGASNLGGGGGGKHHKKDLDVLDRLSAKVKKGLTIDQGWAEIEAEDERRRKQTIVEGFDNDEIEFFLKSFFD